ncbi:hypothetical protein JT242_01830 [Helicobacter pylori]|nr:hypothetical protein [Helicobacter pylori]
MDKNNIDSHSNPERFLETQKYKGSVTALIFLLLFFIFLMVAFKKAFLPKPTCPL